MSLRRRQLLRRPQLAMLLLLALRSSAGEAQSRSATMVRAHAAARLA